MEVGFIDIIEGLVISLQRNRVLINLEQVDIN